MFTADILTSPRRIKLLMQPLLVTSTKIEEIAFAKLRTWWHLIVALGDHLQLTYEQVCNANDTLAVSLLIMFSMIV